MSTLTFYDAWVYYGRPEFGREHTLQTLLAAMERENISRAVAVAYEQLYAPPDTANDRAFETAASVQELYALAVMTPTCTGEADEPERLIGPKTAGFLLCPEGLQIPKRPIFLKEWFAYAEQRRVPVWYEFQSNADYEYAADILAAFPRLTMVLFHDENWPNARKCWPLFQQYPNLYAGTSDLIWLGGIEAFVGRLGHERLLYSSRYPAKYYGSSKLSLLHADISHDAKTDIAAGNFKRLLGGIKR